MKVLNDQIAVERVATKTLSPAGVVIPDVSQRKATRGRVVAVGPGKMHHGCRIPPWVRVDDFVVFSPNVGYEAEVEGRELVFLREDNVLAVLDAPPPVAEPAPEAPVFDESLEDDDEE